ncbi:MAG: TetR/AcrR family transcriptional regulator [Ilumatobacteraceae bacterium]
MPDTKPRQRAPRREPDLDAVLEAAVESLLAHGERGFRIEHIIEKTGISRSSLYLHFTDRDGLVEVASVEIFFREVVENVDRTVAALDQVTTKEQARAVVRPLLEAIAAQPESTRWNRVMVLAASRYRDQLRSRLTAMQTELNDKLTAALQRWADKGFLRPGVDPREVASFIQVNTFGRVIRDLDEHRAPGDAWMDLMVLVHHAFMAE